MSNWKGKINAYLHDPPEKVLDLAWHKQRAEAHAHGVHLDDKEFYCPCDHAAAAADRLPWPKPGLIDSQFDGDRNHFKHPLGRASYKIDPFRLSQLAHDCAWNSRPILAEGDDRAQFFAFWRLWRWWASEKDARLAFLPADTRLPDHTIWVHNSVVSALQGCVVNGRLRPAFLLMQIGPVQEYIAQARRTLDLWSGSYLLSYLVAAGLKHIALNYGPDHVIFPNLCGQPIFDLVLRDEIWTRATVVSKESGSPLTLWDCFGYEKTKDGQPNDYGRRRLLTPSLPNRFLAIVPDGRDGKSAAQVAHEVEKAIRDQFREIAEAVWRWASQHLRGGEGVAGAAEWDKAELKGRYDRQCDRFLSIGWQVLPWPESPDEVFEKTAHLPQALDHEKDEGPRAGLWTILEMARRTPHEDRDYRNFVCERFPAGTRNAKGQDISGWKDPRTLTLDAKLDNIGTAWSALYQWVSWQLDAVRQTRAWNAWSAGGWDVGPDLRKDALNGKEEAILDLTGRTEEEIEHINKQCGIPHLLKAGELIGASTLIKRVWPTAWLLQKHPFLKSGDFSMPDTRQIADGRPFAQESGDEGDEEEARYFAVLALDGDEMGKWISGLHEKMPRLGQQLSDYVDPQTGQRAGAKVYFEKSPASAVLERRRPLSPSFHLQFSEMLANFANVCVRRIVEAHDGRLIYAGGDDVLALLPAHQALACARALREAFRGNREYLNTLRGAWRGGRKENVRLFNVEQEGFIQLHEEAPALQGEPKKFCAMVPGPAADCSAGIAIAHHKTPLQEVVRAAQDAEKRAKKRHGRSAVAVTLMKRSGDIVEWGCQWDRGGLDAYEAMAKALRHKTVSAKFPHRIVELVERYMTDENSRPGARTSDPEFAARVHDVLERDVIFTAERQRGERYSAEDVEELRTKILNYLEEEFRVQQEKVPAKAQQIRLSELKVRALIGLCETVAFTGRIGESFQAERQAS